MTTVAIIGAGALGLAGARRLAQQGVEVTVYEREPVAGGLAAGVRIGQAWLEKFYHHIFKSDRRMIALIEELDLSDRLIWGRPTTTSLRNGQIRRLDGPLEVLRYTPLSPLARLRLGLGMALLKLISDPERLEGQTAAHWLRTWLGKECYEVVWRPLLTGKFGAAADQIGMPWFWARVHDRTSQLGYLRGGFQQLYDALAADIRRGGGRIELDCPISSIEPRGDRIFVDTPRGGESYNAVLCSLPTRLFTRLTRGLPETYRQRFGGPDDHLSAQCLVLELDRSIQSAYWVNISDPGYPFLALVEHTNWLPTEDYGGRHLVYLGNYLAPDHDLLRKSPAELVARFTPHLQRINPAFEPGWIQATHSFQAPFAQPIVRVGYRESLPPHETPIANLWLANMAHVYPHDRGQNYSALLGESVADRLLSRLAQQARAGQTLDGCPAIVNDH
jgi:protoporphyrinogen oxidase